MIFIKELLRKRGGFVQLRGHSMPANGIKELYLPSLNFCTAFAIDMTWSRVREGLPRSAFLDRRESVAWCPTFVTLGVAGLKGICYICHQQ